NPGLTNADANFSYGFGGDLTGCQSNQAGAPTAGTVEAGKVVTDPATGEQFQEPIPTGTGSCASSTTTGTAIVRWNDGTATVVQYATTGAAGAPCGRRGPTTARGPRSRSCRPGSGGACAARAAACPTATAAGGGAGSSGSCRRRGSRSGSPPRTASTPARRRPARTAR